MKYQRPRSPPIAKQLFLAIFPDLAKICILKTLEYTSVSTSAGVFEDFSISLSYNYTSKRVPIRKIIKSQAQPAPENPAELLGI